MRQTAGLGSCSSSLTAPPTGVQRLLLGALRVRYPPPRCPIADGDALLAKMSLDERSALANALALALMVLAYRLLAYAALSRRFRSPLR